MTMVANSAMPSPAEASSTYFQAASDAARVRSSATISAETTVVISTAIHNKARPLTSVAQIIDQANRLNAT
jgi:hypothetical protein